MKLIINGQERSFEVGINVSQLIEQLNIKSEKVAIERNLEIVPRANYSETQLSDGDKIEIVQFIGGG